MKIDIEDSIVEEEIVQALYESDKVSSDDIHDVADAIMEALRHAGEGYE